MTKWYMGYDGVEYPNTEAGCEDEEDPEVFENFAAPEDDDDEEEPHFCPVCGGAFDRETHPTDCEKE